jgi:hypothetical protein
MHGGLPVDQVVKGKRHDPGNPVAVNAVKRSFMLYGEAAQFFLVGAEIEAHAQKLAVIGNYGKVKFGPRFETTSGGEAIHFNSVPGFSVLYGFLRGCNSSIKEDHQNKNRCNEFFHGVIRLSGSIINTPA